MTGGGIAWAIAPLSAGLLAFFLWRGRLAGRLMFDALALGVTLGAAVATALAPFELKNNPLHFSVLTMAFVFAGLVEEGVKVLGAAAFLRPHWRVRGRRDVVYAAGVFSLGFAALENVFYLANAGSAWTTLAVVRALTATPFHVFTGLAAGYVAAGGVAWAFAGWLALAAIHGAFDFAILADMAGSPPPEIFQRAVAALGLDMTTTLRVVLGAAETAAALAALAAVATLPPPARVEEGRFLQFATSRGLGLLLGGAVSVVALLALALGVFTGWAMQTSSALFAVGLYAILPLGLGALFLFEPTRKRELSQRVKRALGAGVLATALALGAAAFVWGPGQWRALNALRYEALGAKLQAEGDYTGAIDAYTQAIAVAPERIEALSQRATAYLADGRYKPALADLDSALKITPDNVGLYALRADVDRQNNDYPALLADLGAALKLKPGDPQLLALRAQARLESGDSRGAYADLSAALRAAPDNALVRRILAAWSVDAGDLDAALRDLNALLHATPGDSVAAFQRGRVWLYKNEAKLARDDFIRADNKPTALYPALWRFLAEARLGTDGRETLRKRLVSAPAKWPAPVARAYLGEIGFAAARAQAANEGERCEADFYYGALRLREDPAEASAARLRAALGECPPGFIEYEGAKAELRRLMR